MTGPDGARALLRDGPRVLNVGLERFAADLDARGVPVLHVGWRPPAGGDVAAARRLAALDDGAVAATIRAANEAIMEGLRLP